MGKCFVKKYGVSTNSNLHLFGKIKLKFKVDNLDANGVNGGAHQLIGANDASFTIDLKDTNVTFKDGSQHFECVGLSNPSTSFMYNAKDEEFTLVFNKYNVGYLTLVDKNSSYRCSYLQSSFDIKELKHSKHIFGLHLASNLCSGDIKNLEGAKLKGDWTITSKNVFGNIKYLKDAIWAEDSAYFITNSGIGGDASFVPGNVAYINLGNHNTNKDALYTWTRGNRTGTENKIMCSLGTNSMFATSADVDNMLIDQSTCTFSPVSSDHGGNNALIITNTLDGKYSPSKDAQNAIATLKGKGLTKIIINNVEL